MKRQEKVQHLEALKFVPYANPPPPPLSTPQSQKAKYVSRKNITQVCFAKIWIYRRVESRPWKFTVYPNIKAAFRKRGQDLKSLSIFLSTSPPQLLAHFSKIPFRVYCWITRSILNEIGISSFRFWSRSEFSLSQTFGVESMSRIAKFENLKDRITETIDK